VSKENIFNLDSMVTVPYLPDNFAEKT